MIIAALIVDVIVIVVGTTFRLPHISYIIIYLILSIVDFAGHPELILMVIGY